ncbi:MAG: phytanoyl-CoA dioxygenase family protein [Chloroflexota bacterium]|nr:phytanoyl-CoA dioxygenase family protein [Chloroflexota bacterium]MDE2946246.1 phytanoyl-CoA dioxygenase family protein [Chloroflexota bacterium]
MPAPATNISEFAKQGYTMARGLFSLDEAAALREHFLWINENHQRQSDNITDKGDPLAQYPRVGQMHRWDEMSLNWLLDPRLNEWMTAILGREPLVAQSMYYFKPPGARGQALHQDQFYLRVQPGTCVAAWMAVDRCDEENGCLFVVPGTHDIPVLCTVDADTNTSFVNDTVELPPGYEPIPLIMEPGAVLFFNGQLVHGSYPNTSADRFRCAMIGHYIVGEAEAVAQHYHPILRMDGSEIDFGVSERGGPCGVWVDRDGEPVAVLEGVETRIEHRSRRRA